jgi:hypothetical protein
MTHVSAGLLSRLCRSAAVASVLLPLGFSVPANGAIFGGVEFPQGAISFADAVVSFAPPPPGPGRPDPAVLNPADALGPPNYVPPNGVGYVSLGDGGNIVLQFTNNALTGSGTSDFDLWIFEIGPDVEDTFVDISKDGTTWFQVGKVFGATSGINIDAFGWGVADQFFYVRLTDDTNEGQQTGSTVGADIDAVGAISTVPADRPVVPEPVSLVVWGIGALGCAIARSRRRKQTA